MRIGHFKLQTFLVSDIYSQYINYLQKLESFGLNPAEEVEKHHSIPKHTGYSTKLVVYCTQANHTLAHYYRFLAYGEKGDRVAYRMRKNQSINSRERALLAVEKNKRLALGFWNSEFQSKQGKKGGKVGGLQNTIKQKAARQKVGLKYGAKTGSQNQSLRLKKSLSKQRLWFYEENVLFTFFVFSCPSTSTNFFGFS